MAHLQEHVRRRDDHQARRHAKPALEGERERVALLSARKGQVALFGSGGRGKVAEFKPGDVAYIPQGFGHAIKNVGDEDLEIVQTWDNGQFEEIDLAKWVQSSPRYLLANNFAGVAETTITRLKQT